VYRGFGEWQIKLANEVRRYAEIGEGGEVDG